MEGRVEMCHNNSWKGVCSTMWGLPEANVSCRQLGLQDPGQVIRLLYSLFQKDMAFVWYLEELV